MPAHRVTVVHVARSGVHLLGWLRTSYASSAPRLSHDPEVKVVEEAVLPPLQRVLEASVGTRLPGLRCDRVRQGVGLVGGLHLKG